MVYKKINNPNEIFTAKYINYTELIFHYDSNNLRIPYYKNIPIGFIKILDDTEINYISSLKFIPNNQIICGELFQNLADIVIGNENSLNFNPNNIKYSKEIISINKINNIDNYNSIFVFTHDLEDFYNKFGDQLHNKILLSHNSDHEINKIENVNLHIAQNCLIKNNKLVSIPIGIENTQWFDHNIFYKIKNMKIQKSKDVYFYFNLNTHPSRYECYFKLVDKLTWNIQRSKEDYFIELSKHKYAICPRGNGIDTHRLWECLYLDVIPIVIENDFPNIDNLPIIVLKNWDEFSFFNLSFKNQIIEKLTINYYKKYIK
jgi:hypothetical protein